MSDAVRLATVRVHKWTWLVTASEHALERMQERNRGAELVVDAIRAIGSELHEFRRTDTVLIRFYALEMSVVLGFNCDTKRTVQVVTVMDNIRARTWKSDFVRDVG